MDGLELWKNPGQAQVVILRAAANGPRHELISGGRTFTISPDDRRMNQNMAANEDLDIFSNGILQPVQLLEETEERLLGNPNHMGEDDIRSFFKLHHKTYEKRIADISNPVLLQRLLDVAKEQDATVRQVEMIQQRLDTVAPPLSQPDDIAGPVPHIKPVTPR